MNSLLFLNMETNEYFNIWKLSVYLAVDLNTKVELIIDSMI